MPDSKRELDPKAKAEYQKSAEIMKASAAKIRKIAAEAAKLDNQVFDVEKVLQ